MFAGAFRVTYSTTPRADGLFVTQTCHQHVLGSSGLISPFQVSVTVVYNIVVFGQVRENQVMVTAFFSEAFFSETESGEADGKCHIGSAVMSGQHGRVSLSPELSTLGIGQ